MKKLSKVTIYDANRNSPRDTSGGVGVVRQFEKMPEIKHQLGEPTKLSCSFFASSPVVLNDEIKKRSVLRLHYDDGSINEYRVVSTQRNYSGEQSFKVNGEDIITDLSTKQVARKLSTGEVQFAFPMSGITANDALTKLLSTDYNAPDHIQLGTTPTEATEVIGDIQINGSTHLDAIRQVISQIDVDGIEFETSYDSGNDVWKVDFVKRIGSTTAKNVNIAISGGINNRIENTANAKSQNEFSNIIPFAGDEEDSGGIQKNFFHVENVNLSGDTYITLDQTIDDIASINEIVSYYLYNIDKGQIIGVIVSRNGKELKVNGDVTAAVDQDDFVRVYEDSNEELYRLSDEEAENELGDIEWVYRNESISKYPNMISLVGATPDMSSWTNGMPDGWGTSGGSPTVSESTDSLHVVNGSSSAKVEAAEDERIFVELNPDYSSDSYYTNVVPALEDEFGKFYSTWVNVYIESGEVEVNVLNGDVTVLPTTQNGTVAASDTNGWVQFSISAMDLALTNVVGDSVWLLVGPRSGSAVFYVDSATVTNSLNAQPYRKKMGPNDLWVESAKYLNRYAGRKSAGYKVRCYDPNVYDSNNDEIQIGDDIRLREGAQLDKTLRCTGLTYTENRKYGRPIKKLTLEDTNRKNIGYFFDTTFQKRSSKQKILPSNGERYINMDSQ